SHLLRALALAQQKYWVQAWMVVKQYKLLPLDRDALFLPISRKLMAWIASWLEKIIEEQRATEFADRPAAKKRANKAAAPAKQKEINRAASITPAAQAAIPQPEPPKVPSAQIPLEFQLPGASQILIPDLDADRDPTWFKLRADAAHLSL